MREETQTENVEYIRSCWWSSGKEGEVSRSKRERENEKEKENEQKKIKLN